MIKDVRTKNNIYHFITDRYPDLTLKLSASGNVVEVIFPKDCISKSSTIIDGKVVFIQYVKSVSDDLDDNTYDGLEDDNYAENMERLIRELKL